MVNSKEVPLSFPLVLINPVIVKKEQEGVFPLDGCLSLPGVSKSETKRFFSIQLEAYSPDRDLIQIETSGILSICLQHEIDHLDGILFVDRLIQPADKNEILADIQDFEEDPKERRKWKKLKTMDARAYVEAQSPRWT
jgi:peptide deformylase